LRLLRFTVFCAGTASTDCRPTRNTDLIDSGGSVTKSASQVTDCKST